MNKLANIGKLGALTVFLGLALFSCKKDTTAFPTQSAAGGTDGDFVYTTPTLPSISDADGILAAVHAHNYRIVVLSPFQQEYQYGMAAFTNTTGNFSMLTSGGNVTIDNMALTANSNMLYQSNATTYSIGLEGTNNWSVTGDVSVPAMSYTDTSDLPKWTLFSTHPTISYWKDEWVPVKPREIQYPTPVPSTDTVNYPQYQADSTKYVTDSVWNETPFLEIPLQGYVSGTDTVSIHWHDDAGFKFEKKFAATDSLATIKPNDFKNMQTYSSTADFMMEVNLIKYNAVLTGGKKYYYLKMSSHMKYWRTE